MKKVLAFLLVFAMILSSTAMVFADPGEEHSISYYDYRVDPWSYTGEEEWVRLGAEDLEYPMFSYTEGQDPMYLVTYIQSTAEKEFQGWYDAKEGGHYVGEISSDWTDDIDLYAQWYEKPQLVSCSPWEAVDESKIYNPFITISHEDLADGTASVVFKWYKDEADGTTTRITNAGIRNDDGTYTSYFFDEPVSAAAVIGEYRAYAVITKDLGNGGEYYSYLDDATICYAEEGTIGCVDGEFYQDGWSLFSAISEGSTVELLGDAELYGYTSLYSRDVTINANGHSVRNLTLYYPVTINNPGGSWELTLDNGDYEDDCFMMSGFVNVNNAAEDANFRIAFVSEIDDPSGYYFMSGMDASDVSVALSGYAAYNYDEYVGLIESTALPYAVEAERDEEGLITKFEFFSTLENAQWFAEDKTVYVVDYYNSTSDALVNVYDCYSTPDSELELRTLYRTTDGNNTSFYLYTEGAFAEQYNNGATIDMPKKQKESIAVLNCYLHEDGMINPIDHSGVMITNTWKEITGGKNLLQKKPDPKPEETDPNLKKGGAYYFTNKDVVISNEGKYTLIAKGGSITVAPAKDQDPTKIFVNVVGELSSLTIAEGVRCAVGLMYDYPWQTRIDYIENHGSLGIGGYSSNQTNIKQLVNSGVVKATEDLVIKKMDCLSDFTAITNLEGGKMYLKDVYMEFAGDGKDVEIVGIENRGYLQLLDTNIMITNTGGSYGVGIENIGGTALIGKPQTAWDYNWITVTRGYGITNRNYLTNEGELTVYGLYCQVNEDYKGESAAIKAEDESAVIIKGGQKKDRGGETFVTVELCAAGKNSYGLDFADSVYWSIMGSRNGVYVRGGKAALKAKVEFGYQEYITTGIFLSDNQPFDIYYAGGTAARGADILLPDSNYYFDWDSAVDFYGCSGVIVRNAEAELVEYLEAPYDQYEPFVLPCHISIGRYAQGADHYYGAYAKTTAIDIELPGRVVDLNGYNIYVDTLDKGAYALFRIFAGDLALINSSGKYISTIDGQKNVETLVEVFSYDFSEEPVLLCDNIAMENADYDIYGLDGGVVIKSGIYYDEIDFGYGVNVIYDGQFDNQSNPLKICDWSHTSGKQDGNCLILKGGQYTGSYERVEWEYSDEENEPNSFFAKDENDTTALIPYGYELNAYDWDGNKIRTITEADFVERIEDVYYEEEYDYVITDKSITLDFTLGKTAAVCRVEKAEEKPVDPPYNPPAPVNPGSSTTKSYTLTFDVNGGNALEQIKAESGTIIDLTKYVPVKAGYEFEGWFSDKALTQGVSSINLKKNTTVYAKWAEKQTVSVPFVDVPDDAYFKDAVYWAVNCGITKGTGADSFSPYKLCTRAEDITFLYRAAKGAGGHDAKTLYFYDVPAGSYYEDALLWAVGNGVTTGTWEGCFSPDLETSREVFVTMLYRTACLADPNAKKAGEAALAKAKNDPSLRFGDVEQGSYYEEAVYWAKEAGVVSGVGDTMIGDTWVSNAFGLGRIIDRAQIVTMLCRWFGKQQK